MAEKKKYTAEEILKEAIGLNQPAYTNDLNNSGSVTPADARIALRQQLGLEPAEGQTGTELTPTQMYTQYLDAYKNNQFNYDQYSDPIYQQARDAAMRQGALASKNVQAQAAANTGGYGNSYGAMAAGQAYNQYLQSVNDMVPELAQNAYNRYQDEQNRNLTLTQMYLDMENRDYNRAMNEAQLAAQYGDYGGLNALGINTEKYESKEDADRAWEELTRKRQMTEWDQSDEDRAWSIALQAANLGDYTKIQKLGFDTSTQERRDALDEAIKMAQVAYDYSGLKKLGIDTAFLEAQKAAAWADLYGTGSGNGTGNGKGNGNKNKDGNGDGDGAEEWSMKTQLTDADRQSLRGFYQAYGLTPLGNASSGPYKGWVYCKDADGVTTYVCVGTDGKVHAT